jgi:hypothetical protein
MFRDKKKIFFINLASGNLVFDIADFLRTAFTPVTVS